MPQSQYATTLIENCLLQVTRELTRLLNSILHSPAFQTIEGRWRALRVLATEAKKSKRVILKLLQCTSAEGTDDFKKQDIAQARLNQLLNEKATGTAGAYPISLLLVETQLNLSKKQSSDNYHLISALSSIAKKAIFPIITSTTQLNLKSIHACWHELRQKEQAQFLTFSTPPILMRQAYKENDSNLLPSYKEDTQNNSMRLWHGAGHIYAFLLMRNFIETGWFIETHAHDSAAYKQHTASKRKDHITSARLLTHFSQQAEKNNASAGLQSFIEYPSHSETLFYTSNNAHMDDKKQYGISCDVLLCVGRIAHTIKAFAREKIGSYQSQEEIESILNRWIIQYCSKANNMSPRLSADFPLHSASIALKEKSKQNAEYQCLIKVILRKQLNRANHSIHLPISL